MTTMKHRHVHFVGSIALDTVDDVFETCGRTLGERLKRIPDGEPGGRRLWVNWQLPLLRASPYLALDPAIPAGSLALSPLVLREDVQPDEISFGELGYSREARASYLDFVAARDRGTIARGVRFQVSLPTPFAVISPFVVGDGMQYVLAAYDRAMLDEVKRICAAIPNEDLAFQWDICVEMLVWDGQPTIIPAVPDKEKIFPPMLARLIDAVPDQVQVGFHLCYGDFDGKHFIEPKDAARMVSLANAVVAAARRPVNWVHMPVPKNRDDDEYFAPLADLRLSPDTDLFLGLVHDDGVVAIRSRAAAAAKYAPNFGVSTECGIARLRTPAQVTELIEMHAVPV